MVCLCTLAVGPVSSYGSPFDRPRQSRQSLTAQHGLSRLPLPLPLLGGYFQYTARRPGNMFCPTKLRKMHDLFENYKTRMRHIHFRHIADPGDGRTCLRLHE